MQLSDHIRTLLREHDCVIIPDFGGLIADYSPAHIHPVRHTLAPPDKRVAFNQALTRNDGLLVDALSNALSISASQARQLVRDAVANLQRELADNHRTELPGIGVFRYAAGRGLDFEYTGTQNLLSASYGLPELLSRPVRATDALLARERPATEALPMLAAGRRRLGKRVFNTLAAVVVSGLVLSANYLLAERMGYLPESLRMPTEWVAASATEAPVVRQQAALAQASWETQPVAETQPAATPEIKPAADAPTKVPAAVAAVAKPKPKAAPVAAAKAAPASSSTISSITNRWYVVTSTLDNPKSAEQLRQNYLKKGVAVKLLTPRRGNRFVAGTRHYRISVADFADQASAVRKMADLRKSHKLGTDFLVINY